jgi:hypothetical protein
MMRAQIVAIALTAGISGAAPAEAQSIVDTFRQLKSTFKQAGELAGGKPKVGAVSAMSAAPSAQTAAVGDVETDLVPASALADDPSDSAIEQTPLMPRRVETFDVLGYKLGMSPREALRISGKKGVYRKWNSTFLTSGSFEVEAARIANYQLNRPVEASSKSQVKVASGVTMDGSSIYLTFTLEPTGPKLSNIEYTAKRNGSTEEKIVADLVRKYGNYDTKRLVYAWRNGAKEPAQESRNASMLAGMEESTVSITLSQSSDYQIRARKALEQRAQAVAAQKGGGVAF